MSVLAFPMPTPPACAVCGCGRMDPVEQAAGHPLVECARCRVWSVHPVPSRERLEAAQAEQRAEQEKRGKAVETMIAKFDTEVGQALGSVTSASAQLHETAETMTGTATKTVRNTASEFCGDDHHRNR